MATQSAEVDLVQYDKDRKELFRRFHQMRYGVQQEASHDLRQPATIVSQVLRGRVINPRVLGMLKEWLDQNEQYWRDVARPVQLD
jgi:hypothetical protein